MTKREFMDHLNSMLFMLRDTYGLDEEGITQLGLSWDNASNNATDADLPEVGDWCLTCDQRLPLPPYAPDLHKAIEHAIGYVKREFKRLLAEHPGYSTPSEYMHLLRQAFNKIRAAQIMADVQTLRTTYGVVATPKGEMYVAPDGKMHPGSGGDWPANRYR